MDAYNSKMETGHYNSNISQSSSYDTQYKIKNMIGTYSSNDSCGSGIMSAPTMRMS